jgi:hypothetical protein
MAYNGWTNYETWNVNLWIDNDEGTYRAKREYIRGLECVNAENVKQFFAAHMDSTTPDLTGRTDLDVNFAEIAEHWELERLDMQA